MTNATADLLESTADELSVWFARVAEFSGRAFGWERGPHGDASAIHVLRRQAARLRSSHLATDGSSYTTLCLFVAAACRTLSLPTTARHWSAALRNVAEQRRLPSSEELGVAFGTPAERFKLLLDDAIDAAGLGSQVTTLDEKNRKLALGLAVNWSLRTLLAYAAEAKIPKTTAHRGRQDLSWLRAKVRRVSTHA